MRNIKLTIAYDGTNYSGWQIQSNALTVQEVLQKAVRGMTGESNNVVGAGRTDAGVHALAQVAAFRTSKEIPLDGFRRGLNSKLPPDIRIIKIEDVPEGFHPIRDSKSKQYRYIIAEGEYEHPLYLNRAWSIKSSLDIDSMKEAAEYLVGRQDFSAFRASDGSGDCFVANACPERVHPSTSSGRTSRRACPEPLDFARDKLRRRTPRNDSSVREVFGVSVSPHPTRLCHNRFSTSSNTNKMYSSRERSESRSQNRNYDTASPWERGIVIDIIGDGFLKNMVRNIVGTLVDVGLGKTTAEEFKTILDSKDRKKAGVCAPASGLYLVSVEY